MINRVAMIKNLRDSPTAGQASGPFSSLAQLVVAAPTQKAVTPERKSDPKYGSRDPDEFVTEPVSKNPVTDSSASLIDDHESNPRAEEDPQDSQGSDEGTAISRVGHKSRRRRRKIAREADAESTATVSMQEDVVENTSQPEGKDNVTITATRKVVKQRNSAQEIGAGTSENLKNGSSSTQRSSRQRWTRTSDSQEAGTSTPDKPGGDDSASELPDAVMNDREAANTAPSADESMEGLENEEDKSAPPSVRTLIDYKPKGRELPPITGEMILEAMQRARANSPQGSKKGVVGKSRERKAERRGGLELEMENLQEIRVERDWKERIASLKQRVEDIRTKLWQSN